MRRGAIILLVASLAACDDDGAPLAMGCFVSADCPPRFVCVDNTCVEDDGPIITVDAGPASDVLLLDSGAVDATPGMDADAGLPLDAEMIDTGLHLDADAIDTGRHADAEPTDDGVHADAEPTDDGVHADAEPTDDGVHADAEPTDDGVHADAEPTDDGVHADAEPTDDGVHADAEPTDDGVHADADPVDTGAIDAGFIDAGFPDSGPPPPAQPGVYDYRRILVPGIPSNQVLTKIAISPDDSLVLVSASYNTIYVVDRATETSTRSITLPRMNNESVRIESIWYAPGGAYILIAASSIHGSNNSTGRLFRADPRLVNVEEQVNLRRAGQNLQAIAADPASGAIRVMGHPSQTTPSNVVLYEYDDATRTWSDVDATFTSAGCTDIAWAGDGLGGFGVAYVCGINGITLGIFDSTGVFANGPGFGAASNTFKIDARPQGDYALTIESGSTSKLSRFDQGVWTTGFSAVNFGHTGMHNLRFSDDGNRALVTGNYRNDVQRMKEYRHGFYSSNQITDVSIGNFNLGPFLGRDGVMIYDAEWRPGQDCGYVVGGCNSHVCTRGYLIQFTVINGRACR